MDSVAKIIIVISNKNQNAYLMSQKRVADEERDRKLEFLGGHIEKGETPFEGLLRELREEEDSHLLTKKIQTEHLSPVVIQITGIEHYLFRTLITPKECSKLIANIKESHGFDIINRNELLASSFQKKLTPKTRQILHALKTSNIEV